MAVLVVDTDGGRGIEAKVFKFVREPVQPRLGRKMVSEASAGAVQ